MTGTLRPGSTPRADWRFVQQLDARYGPADPGRLLTLVRDLAALVDVAAVDYVLGFPEGGLAPAFAFAQVVDRPVIFSTRLKLPLPDFVTFDEPHSTVGKTHYIHGLRAGHRVVIVEDEVTTGGTVLNAVRALRGAGVVVDDVATLLAVDSPDLWRAVADEKISLRAGLRLPPEHAVEHAARLGKPRPR